MSPPATGIPFPPGNRERTYFVAAEGIDGENPPSSDLSREEVPGKAKNDGGTERRGRNGRTIPKPARFDLFDFFFELPAIEER
jgi:hypothetical protein